MYSFKIKSLSTTPRHEPLFLSVSRDTHRVVAAKEIPHEDASQLWIPMARIDGGAYQGFFLVNMMSMRVIEAPVDRGPVSMIDLSEMRGRRCSWNFAHSPMEGYGAFQLHQEPRMNLNVQGYPPNRDGAPVLAWDWCDCQSNEIWTFVPAAGENHDPFQLFSLQDPIPPYPYFE